MPTDERPLLLTDDDISLMIGLVADLDPRVYSDKYVRTLIRRCAVATDTGSPPYLIPSEVVASW